MAIFTEPAKALVAVEDAARSLAQEGADQALTLKAGLNTGPCILKILLLRRGSLDDSQRHSTRRYPDSANRFGSSVHPSELDPN